MAKMPPYLRYNRRTSHLYLMYLSTKYYGTLRHEDFELKSHCVLDEKGIYRVVVRIDDWGKNHKLTPEVRLPGVIRTCCRSFFSDSSSRALCSADSRAKRSFSSISSSCRSLSSASVLVTVAGRPTDLGVVDGRLV